MMKTSQSSTILAAMMVLIASPIFSQGTFSASAVGGLGTGVSSREKEPPILTADTIGPWLKANEKKARSPRLQAAKSGLVIATSKTAIDYNEKANRYRFRSREDKASEIQRLQIEALTAILPDLNAFALKADQVGPLRRTWYNFRVVQIIDERTAVIGVSRSSSATRFLLISPAVSEFQEGQRRNLDGVFIVEGNRKYQTASGAASTVPVIHSYDLMVHLARDDGADKKHRP